MPWMPDTAPPPPKLQAASPSSPPSLSSPSPAWAPSACAAVTCCLDGSRASSRANRPAVTAHRPPRCPAARPSSRPRRPRPEPPSCPPRFRARRSRLLLPPRPQWLELPTAVAALPAASGAGAGAKPGGRADDFGRRGSVGGSSGGSSGGASGRRRRSGYRELDRRRHLCAEGNQ